MIFYRVFLFFTSTFIFSFTSKIAFAHEAYVLPQDFFWQNLKGSFSTHAFDALKDAGNVHITLMVVLFVLLLFTINFFFRQSRAGRAFHGFLERFSHWGPIIVRITIALALFLSASSNSFLGPELSLDMFPYSVFVRIGLFVISFAIALGVFTEIAAVLAVGIFVWAFFVFGGYMFTYLNYLGEFLVLVLFGMRIFSFDRYIFGPLRHFRFFEKYETAIVRIFYGLALMYAGLTVKFLHPELTLRVVSDWHLTSFHWLFPSDPLLLVLGAGLAEIAIGLLIAIGFEMKLVVFISLFYITLSLIYFKELIWPHLLLYGISLNLLLQPEILTIDHFLFKRHRRIPWWKRLFHPHNTVGKSSKK